MSALILLHVAYQVQQHVGNSFTASDLLVKGSIRLNVWYMYIGVPFSALRINWIRMKREHFIIRRCNRNVYYLFSLFHSIPFWFVLQTVL